MDPIKLKVLEYVVEGSVYSHELNVTPTYTCEFCPFSELDLSRNTPDEIWNDPSEAYYHCGLLEEVVWGEWPSCGQALTEYVREAILDLLSHREG